MYFIGIIMMQINKVHGDDLDEFDLLKKRNFETLNSYEQDKKISSKDEEELKNINFETYQKSQIDPSLNLKGLNKENMNSANKTR